MKTNTFTYFFPEKPTLISKDQNLTAKLSADPDYVAERKYNGIRLQLHFLNGKWQFWGRHQDLLKFTPDAELQKELDSLSEEIRLTVNGKPGYCLLDGELRNNKTKGVRQKIMLFDVFIWNGEVLTGMPFAERRAIIESLVPVDGEPIGCPVQFKGEFISVFNTVTTDDEIEGIVIKNTKAPFKISRTSPVNSSWMFKVRKPSKKYKI
jgi:ATP-dependent DNA ligase